MISDSEMYTEVFEILSYMDKKIVMKIPVEILEYIKKERSVEYKTRINKDDLFNLNNIDQKSINLIAGLNINYIAEDEEKEKLIAICKDNDKKIEEKKQKTYSSKLFDNEESLSKKEQSNSVVKGNMSIYKDNVFSRIKKFFIKLFN